MKKYYKAKKSFEIYSHSIETDVWRIFGITVVTKPDFRVYEIKPSTYNKLINEYFNKAQCKWTYDKVIYQNVLDYNPYKYGEIPYDSETGFSTMFHQGKVYLARYNPNGERYELYDIRTQKFAKWTDGRNLQPILNTKTNKLI